MLFWSLTVDTVTRPVIPPPLTVIPTVIVPELPSTATLVLFVTTIYIRCGISAAYRAEPKSDATVPAVFATDIVGVVKLLLDQSRT